MGQKIYRDLGLTYYLVYYTNDIQVSGKTQKNIVGYDSDSVYVFADSKKKPLSGSTDFKNMVLPTVDVCADFAIAVSMQREKRNQLSTSKRKSN